MECGKDLEKGSLVKHRQNQHRVENGGSGKEGNKEGGEDKPRTFRMLFTTTAGPRT